MLCVVELELSSLKDINPFSGKEYTVSRKQSEAIIIKNFISISFYIINKKNEINDSFSDIYKYNII